MVNLFGVTQCCREETSLTTVSLKVSKSFSEKKQFVSSVKSFILEHLINVWIIDKNEEQESSKDWSPRNTKWTYLL